MVDPVAPIALATLPTPLTLAPDLGRQLRFSNLWIKRDDLTGFSFGGNKVRTLEYLLADALATSCDTIVLCGSPSSNFAALAAVAGRGLGLAVHQVSYGAPPARPVAALEVARGAGAVLHFTGSSDRDLMEPEAEGLAYRLFLEGRRPYSVPRGGATAIGALGYAQAAGEFLRQAAGREMDEVTIVIPVGSGGTLAGLIAGLSHEFGPDDLTKLLTVEVIGVSVSRPPEALRDDVASLALACAKGRPPRQRVHCRWSLVDGRGSGFGAVEEDEARAIRDLMLHSGLLLDRTYNGKALLWLRGTDRKPAGRVVYWHTGGALGVIDHL